MSDIVDDANGLEAEHLARSLARVERIIPIGVAGICDECGEEMPRLVGGCCGFCRDGRTPPPGFYDRPAPVELPIAPQPEPQNMTTPSAVASRKVTIEGDAALAVDNLAADRDIPFKQAANELILAHVAIPSITVPAVEAIPATAIDQFETSELLEELLTRAEGIGRVADLEADLAEMTARAIAAEQRVEATKAALLG